MAKLTVAELDDWADQWRRHIDALLAQPKVAKRVATRKRGRRPPPELSIKCEEFVGRTGPTFVQRTRANRLDAREAGAHQTRPEGSRVNGFLTRQEEPSVMVADGEPEGREV